VLAFGGRVCVLCGLFLGGCASEPVLLSVEEVATPEEVVKEEVKPYAKPEGVFVDVGFFGGRLWNEARAEAEIQMGEIRSRVEHRRDGIELRMGKGSFWIVDDKVQQIRVELPSLMRRSQAMEFLGLPPQVREWHGNERDWVTHHVFGFDRIRMGRHEADSELVVWVEARKFSGRKR